MAGMRLSARLGERRVVCCCIFKITCQTRELQRRKGLAGAGKHSRRSIIQPRACLGCRVNHHKEHFKVKPNVWAKSCLSALAGCQKTREESRRLYEQALRAADAAR